MIPNDQSYELVQARRAELMRIAQHHRLIAEAWPSRPVPERLHTRLYRLTLAWFGHSLVTLGQGLQQRSAYRTVANFPSQANPR